MSEYSIYGGDKGKSRLAVLSRTLTASTKSFLEKAEIKNGFKCLDLGCGGGEVSFMLSKIVGKSGFVTSMDIDERELELAELERNSLGLENIHFVNGNVYELDTENEFDLIYSRFLISHLKDPDGALRKVKKALKPGGTLLLEDTDFSGHFANPSNEAFEQYVRLYQMLLDKRGANANMGQELYWKLEDLGMQNIKVQVSQPVFTEGEGKLMAELTFAGIMPSLLDENLVSKSTAADIMNELIEFGRRKDTMISLPRIFQMFGRKGVNEG